MMKGMMRFGKKMDNHFPRNVGPFGPLEVRKKGGLHPQMVSGK